MSAGFEVSIADGVEADVYLSADSGEMPWELVESLDRAGVRVVGTVRGASIQPEYAPHLIPSCSGVIVASARAPDVDISEVPVLRVDDAERVALEEFTHAAIARRRRVPAYAFLIGRLERDFAHARAAIDAAVNRAAGMPCVWADDRRLRTNCPSVSMRTQQLIQNAQFIVADLTLGVESPERENPSRAHEIGMAIAYGRPLMLCSREPRRSPYFSIQDLQMAFWSDEGELALLVTDWIEAHRDLVARCVFNHRLSVARIAAPSFTLDPELVYSGPAGRVSNSAGRRRTSWRR